MGFALGCGGVPVPGQGGNGVRHFSSHYSLFFSSGKQGRRERRAVIGPGRYLAHGSVSVEGRGKKKKGNERVRSEDDVKRRIFQVSSLDLSQLPQVFSFHPLLSSAAAAA